MKASVASLFRLPASRPITATEWAVRLHSPEITDKDRDDFESWLCAKPAHRAAYERSERLWQITANARAQHEMVDELLKEVDGTTAATTVPRTRKSVWPFALAATMVCVTVAMVIQMSVSSGDAKVATRPGEQRVVHLDDGSTIELNTDTRISYRMGAHVRRVVLARGEAFFDVAKDASRPFVVEAGQSEVRVVGTQFTVRQDRDRIQVVVKEGRVEVIPDTIALAKDKAQRLELTPGNRLEVEHQTIKVAAVDLNRAMAWRIGEIEFRGEPLERVIAELNRYAEVPMVIQDDSLKAIRVSGLFKVSDQQSTRFMLRESLGIEMVERRNAIGLTAKR